MEEIVVLAVKLHQYFIGAMLLVACLNLFFIFTNKDFSKKVKMINPIYYMFFASVGFTGVLVFGINGLHVSHAVALMMTVFLVIFIMSMKLFKVYKYQSNSKYRAFAKKKYILDIILIVTTMGLVYAI